MENVIRVLEGDCQDVLPTLPPESVHCVVTSPPYYGLRDYGTVGQLGLEATPAEYIANMVAVFREVRRVLRNDGTLWLNIGDSYAGSGKGPSNSLSPAASQIGAALYDRRLHAALDADMEGLDKSDSNRGSHKYALVNGGKVPAGLKPKDLIGIPWMLAFALRETAGTCARTSSGSNPTRCLSRSQTGLPRRTNTCSCSRSRHGTTTTLMRSESRTNHMPFRNRPALMALSKAPMPNMATICCVHQAGQHDFAAYNPAGRNKRSVWEIATEPFPEAHFATYPTALVEPCIKAGSPVGGTVLDPFCGRAPPCLWLIVSSGTLSGSS